jgi:1-deoxyxylulose-5-phosphate synthase
VAFGKGVTATLATASLPGDVALQHHQRTQGAPMRYTTLGTSGLHVSRICLGMMSYGNRSERTWHLGEDEAEAIVRHAVEAGVIFFDTADIYDLGASEAVTGRLLGKLFNGRDDYVLATKVFFPMGSAPNDGGLSRKHIMTSIDGSLRRLGTDHVDLYQIHRWDYATPIEETMAALHDVVRAGKARYIGASSMFAWQFAKAQHTARTAGWTRFSSMQNHYNLIYREEEREMIPLCLDQGVGIIPWSPLARGLLTGSRQRGTAPATVRAGDDPLAGEMYSDDDFDVVDAVRELSAEGGLPPAQIALAWLLGQPGVAAPIIGATKIRHIDDALAAVEVTLSEKEVRRLEAPYRPHSILGHH